MLEYLATLFQNIFLNVEQNSLISQLNADSAFMMCLGVVLICFSMERRVESLILLPMGFAIVLANIPGLNFALKGIEAALLQADAALLSSMSNILNLETLSTSEIKQAYLSAPVSAQQAVDRLILNAGYQDGPLRWLYDTAIVTGLAPMLIFLGIGAMTDISNLIAKPKILLVGLAAQLGIFAVLIAGALLSITGHLSFSLEQIAAISLLGSADGSLVVLAANELAEGLLVPLSVVAYLFIALLPMIQPTVMRMLTSRDERLIKMSALRPVSRLERIVAVSAIFMFVVFFVPVAVSFIGMFCFGLLIREIDAGQRLQNLVQHVLLDLSTFVLAIALGAQLTAEVFFNTQSMGLMALALVALLIGTATGVIGAKVINFFSVEGFNPLIGAAGVSAIPITARVCHETAQAEDKTNYLIMYAMGANIAGFLASAIIASVFLGYF